ncbi:MAG: F0F1 ATP synthase subunit gamma [Alphaproteobacteria bacterium]|nr:F0F1 ATP synthase subunit gamma [Alphaproteobacteria bacterium]
MASLKDLRNRIRSVRSTQKITSAMKMVAASRLRRAQEQALAARPYAERMERMLGSLATNLRSQPNAPKLLAGTGSEQTHLLLVATSDRGLAGGFNASILREARRTLRQLQRDGRQVKIFTIGRKGRDALRRDHAKLILENLTEIGRPRLTFANAEDVAGRLVARFEAGEFDVCTVIFNRFKSAISQIVTKQQLIPFAITEAKEQDKADLQGAIYEFEPEESEILTELLPRNLAVQIFTALLENAASEQGARMTAMDNATRNAGEMIDRLNITYNRSRQAAITKELIEIISGAEAL